MSLKPSNPKGTRDFNPLTLARRRYIIENIKSVFTSFGYNEIETPSIEKRPTLHQKYGSEGDKFIFNIINSGEKIKKADIKSFDNEKYNDFISSISEKGLRFDLTVPLARYVSQHQNEITFPFKRFQIQNVWRADRPQKGRYQEFTQCDADVIGSKSILLEFEMLQLFSTVFKRLKLDDVKIRVNHRKVLNKIADHIGLKNDFNEFLVVLDKIDKIGIDKVKDELKSKFSKLKGLDKLFELISKKVSPKIYLENLRDNYLNIGDNALLDELETLVNLINDNNNLIDIDFDFSLVRGLEYYTGLIYEISLDSKSDVGSLGGGGRYENLTEAFNLRDNSGIGISFGLDRIYHVIDDKNLFPKNISLNNDVLVINFGKEYILKISNIINELRSSGVNVSVYPDSNKLSKQFTYSDKNNFNYALIFGESERERNRIKIRDLKSGSETEFQMEKFIEKFNLL
jgi:histidyl-tRNA synthetase